MRRRTVNSYVLSVGLLVAEYVRQTRAAGGAEASDDPPAGAEGTRVGRATLSELVRFLCAEIQHPLGDGDGEGCRTSLVGLLSRLERALSDAADFNVLSSVLVGVLAGVDSPDAVENVIDRVAECVAPLDGVAAGGTDVGAASAVLARQSVLGVFVRKFLLATSRLLFDGLSRLFDDVQQYLQRFRDDCDHERRSAAQQATANQTWSDGELLLSPINVGFSSIAEDTPASSASSVESTSPPPLSASSFQSPNLVAPTPFRLEDADVLPKDASDAAVWTSEQLDVILDDAMQRIRKGASQRDCSNFNPEELPASVQVARALASQGDASDRNALYVKYLDRLHSRDYQGALHALHQYHDVIPADYSRERALLSGSMGIELQRNHLSNISATHFRGTGVQYAALNLAGLQIVFDHYDAAQESLLEAIRVAQHHGDHVCVAFSLSWMVQIAQKLGKPKHDVLPLVKNCMERAKELYLPTLRVLSALADIEVELTRGSSESPPLGSHGPGASTQLLPHVFVAQSPGPRPAEIWAQVEQSAHDAVSLFVRASSSSGQGPSANGGRAGASMLQHAQQQAAASGGVSGNDAERHSRGMTWARSGDAVLEVMWQMRGNVHLSSAVAWRLFGNRPLEQVFSRLFAACYRDVASLEEMIAVVSRMALHSLSDSINDIDGSGNGANVYLRSLQFVVDAVDQFADQPAQRQWIHQASFQRMVHHLLFLLALRRGEYLLASAHLDVVQNLSPEKNLLANIEAQLNRAILLAEIGDCQWSLSLLKTLEAKCTRLELVYLLAQVLLVTGKVQLRWSFPHASGSALPSILKCIDVCKQHHYDLLLSEAHLIMAELFLSMGKAHEAQALVRDEMPLAMEHGTVHLRGEAMLLLAKAELAGLTRHNNGESETKSSGNAGADHVLRLLADSQYMFAACQDVRRLVEVNYLMALVYNHVLSSVTSSFNGMDARAIEDRREAASKQFIKYQQGLNQARSTTLESTASFESVEDIRNVIKLRSHDL